jgi:hypothetical protein
VALFDGDAAKKYSHLDKPNSAAQLIYIDFSSAFNTISPLILSQKLREMKVNPYLNLWLCSFLTERVQRVRFNTTISSDIITNTGAPQGCVLSPLLFTLYTSDCRATHPNCRFIKYADDTVLVNLIDKRGDNTFVREQTNVFVQWCTKNHLTLNIKKTKDMIVDFGRTATMYEDIVVNGDLVERVENYKYLGTIINNKLCWTENINLICSKTRKRTYFLRKLREFDINPSLLRMFYNSVVLSVVTFSIPTWFGNLPNYLLDKLERIDKTASKLIRDGHRSSLEDIATRKTLDIVKRILNNANHPLREHFCLLRSGVRFKSIKARTNRLSNSFIAQAIRLLNELPPQERSIYTTVIHTDNL